MDINSYISSTEAEGQPNIGLCGVCNKDLTLAVVHICQGPEVSGSELPNEHRFKEEDDKDQTASDDQVRVDVGIETVASLHTQDHTASQFLSHSPVHAASDVEEEAAVVQIRGQTAVIPKDVGRLTVFDDVRLVSSSDKTSIRLQSALLACCCPLLAEVLQPLHQSLSEDILTVIIPHISEAELVSFQQYLHGVQGDQQQLPDTSGFLFSLINFQQRSSQPPDGRNLRGSSGLQSMFSIPAEDVNRKIDEDDNDVDMDMDHQYSGANLVVESVAWAKKENGEEEFKGELVLKTRDVKKLMTETPFEVELRSISDGPTVLVQNFVQVEVRGRHVPFVQCKYCEAIFMQKKADLPSLVLARHVRQHSSHKDGEAAVDAEKENATAGETPAKKRRRGRSETVSEVELEEEGDRREMIVGDENWDPGLIQQMKSELQVPLQRQSGPVQGISKSGVGVSKLALIQLIESESSRVTYERCQTHSVVWDRFLKIYLDKVEVPFVCCMTCRKVYVHERSLGTSSLLRHVCNSKEPKTTLTAGQKTGLPKLLVQELVNTESNRIVRKDLSVKLNRKLEDITHVFDRIAVDNKETGFIACRQCNKLFLLAEAKTNQSVLLRRIEQHVCYIRLAPCLAAPPARPDNERQLRVVLVRQPERISLAELVRSSDPHLHMFLLDGQAVTDYYHCTRCLKFIHVSSLSFAEERLHRCQKLKSASHVVQARTKTTEVPCLSCAAVFRSEHFLEIHRRREHGEGSATVMCTYCAKDFPTERLAKKHELNVHHPELSKRFKCTFKDCDMAFHDRSKLRLHSLKHSNQKPYVCEECGKGFNYARSFQDHMDIHAGVKKHTCEFCQKNFTKRNTLNNHRRIHTGEKPFMCPAAGCGLTFVQRTACKTHAKKRHNINITMYTRNPEVPLTAAGLAQMSNARKLEYLKIRDRQMNTEVIEVPAEILAKLQGQTIQISQLSQGQGQVIHIIHPFQVRPEEDTERITASPDPHK